MPLNLQQKGRIVEKLRLISCEGSNINGSRVDPPGKIFPVSREAEGLDPLKLVSIDGSKIYSNISAVLLRGNKRSFF